MAKATAKGRSEATTERLDRLHTLIPKGKPVSGHCLLAAEAELGLIRYRPTEENPSGNRPKDLEELKARCEGAWFAKPYDESDHRVIRCSAPWHDGSEVPPPRPEKPSVAEEKRLARQAALRESKREARGDAPVRVEGQCRNGHTRTEENTYTDPRGSQVCRDCKKEAAARHKAKKEGRA